jgi:hypothetical protein
MLRRRRSGRRRAGNQRTMEPTHPMPGMPGMIGADCARESKHTAALFVCFGHRLCCLEARRQGGEGGQRRTQGHAVICAALLRRPSPHAQLPSCLSQSLSYGGACTGTLLAGPVRHRRPVRVRLVAEHAARATRYLCCSAWPGDARRTSVFWGYPRSSMVTRGTKCDAGGGVGMGGAEGSGWHGWQHGMLEASDPRRRIGPGG